MESEKVGWVVGKVEFGPIQADQEAKRRKMTPQAFSEALRNVSVTPEQAYRRGYLPKFTGAVE